MRLECVDQRLGYMIYHPGLDSVKYIQSVYNDEVNIYQEAQ